MSDCKTHSVKTISFGEIVQGRDANVRVTDDGCLHAVDLVMVVTGCDGNYAGQVLRRLPDETFPSCKLHERSLPGKGNANVKVLTFKDAIELVMVLPGKVAKETRTQFADIIRRYMAGDQSMHAELNANAASKSPIADLARASLAGDRGQVDAMDVGFKRRREELELRREELELQKLEQDIKQRDQEMRLKDYQHSYQKYRALEEDIKRISNAENSAGMEERARLMLKDGYMNLLLPWDHNTHQKQEMLITNDGCQASKPNENKPISIASVASELGYRLSSSDAKRIGIDLRKRYMAKHNGKQPPKHEQMCDGRVTWVNSYTERDRELVEASIRSYFSCGGSSASDGSM